MLFSMEKIPFLWLGNTGVKPPFSKLAGSNYKNHWSRADQVKQKVNCGKLSLEFNSVRAAAHKERPVLKHGQIHLEKWIPPLHGLFKKTQRRVIPSENSALSSINKDQLRDFVELFKSENDSRHQHCRCFYAGSNLITSHQVDYMSSDYMLKMT